MERTPLGVEPWRLLFRARRAGWRLDHQHAALYPPLFDGDLPSVSRWREWRNDNLDGVTVMCCRDVSAEYVPARSDILPHPVPGARGSS